MQTVLDLSSIAGLRQLSARQVCAAAEVAPRTLYRHFRDIDAAFTEGYRRLDDQLAAAILEAYRQHLDPQACARACVDAGLGFILRDQLAAEAFFVHGFEAGPEVAAMRARRIAWMRDLVAVRLGQVTEGPLSAAQEFAVELAIGGVLELVYRYVRDARTSELGEARDVLVHTLLRTLTSPSQPATAKQPKRP